MSDSHPKTKSERTFYPNGQLATEMSYVGDLINGAVRDGVIRRWHENGTLASEVPVRNSKTHGTMRQWDPQGHLLGDCDFVEGTGISRTWYNNGTLKSEMYERDGVPHGRLRTWDEGGELLGEQFFVSGRQVSKRKYQEAYINDPSLPRYDVDDGQIPWAERYIEPAVEQHIMSTDDYEDARDALEWLQDSSEQSIRTLGELASAEESIELVREFMDNGATKVLAVHIQVEDIGETTSELLVELPSEPLARKKALEFCSEQNRLCGYSPIKDTSQRFMHVVLD